MRVTAFVPFGALFAPRRGQDAQMETAMMEHSAEEPLDADQSCLKTAPAEDARGEAERWRRRFEPVPRCAAAGQPGRVSTLDQRQGAGTSKQRRRRRCWGKEALGRPENQLPREGKGRSAVPRQRVYPAPYDHRDRETQLKSCPCFSNKQTNENPSKKPNQPRKHHCTCRREWLTPRPFS